MSCINSHSKAGCVAKTEAADAKVGNRCHSLSLNFQVQLLQGASLRSPNYPTLRPLVPQLSAVIPPSSRDGKRAGLEVNHTTAKRASAAKRFFRKTLKAVHTQTPRVITVDTVDEGVGTPDPNNLKNAAYPKAIDKLKVDKELPKKVKSRQKKYLNNIVEQDHREIKRLIKSGMELSSFNTTRGTLKEYEIINMIRKG